MTTMRVSLNGTELFQYPFDTQKAVASIERRVKRSCKRKKLPPPLLGSETVMHIAKVGFWPPQRPGEADYAMRNVLFFILQQETGKPGMPGQMRNYAAAYDSVVDLRTDGAQIGMTVTFSGGTRH